MECLEFRLNFTLIQQWNLFKEFSFCLWYLNINFFLFILDKQRNSRDFLDGDFCDKLSVKVTISRNF